eukprot:4655878-Pyramimonas_sp.AAC.2
MHGSDARVGCRPLSFNVSRGTRHRDYALHALATKGYWLVIRHDSRQVEAVRHKRAPLRLFPRTIQTRSRFFGALSPLSACRACGSRVLSLPASKIASFLRLGGKSNPPGVESRVA